MLAQFVSIHGCEKRMGLSVEETDESRESRPIGVLIIHVSACGHDADARHAANICLISSIKVRPVYPSPFGRVDLGPRGLFC